MPSNERGCSLFRTKREHVNPPDSGLGPGERHRRIRGAVGARIALVQAQRDRLVNSYGLLAAVGRLSALVLGLQVATYDPAVHYHQVRHAWTGVRTPDGR